MQLVFFLNWYECEYVLMNVYVMNWGMNGVKNMIK